MKFNHQPSSFYPQCTIQAVVPICFYDNNLNVLYNRWKGSIFVHMHNKHRHSPKPLCQPLTEAQAVSPRHHQWWDKGWRSFVSVETSRCECPSQMALWDEDMNRATCICGECWEHRWPCSAVVLAPWLVEGNRFKGFAEVGDKHMNWVCLDRRSNILPSGEKTNDLDEFVFISS